MNNDKILTILTSAIQPPLNFNLTYRCGWRVIMEGGDNGYKIYVDIITGEKLWTILVANIDIIYWSVRSSSKRGGDGVKGVDRGIVL